MLNLRNVYQHMTMAVDLYGILRFQNRILYSEGHDPTLVERLSIRVKSCYS